ncbi:MAG: hypothetical protein Q7S91_02175 [Aquabacterium sp.]|nr:hypothetical protein [Aquabacterium sp.]
MNAKLGWTLAVAAVALGYVQYGWRGVLLAVSGIVFWLLMQFTRALRAMRAAGGAPVGRVASAVMLHAALKKGQRLMDVIQLTRSLGQKLADESREAPETWRWQDESGTSVTVQLRNGRVTEWQLQRPVETEAAAPSA